jgi:hypothetical protein
MAMVAASAMRTVALQNRARARVIRAEDRIRAALILARDAGILAPTTGGGRAGMRFSVAAASGRDKPDAKSSLPGLSTGG